MVLGKGYLNTNGTDEWKIGKRVFLKEMMSKRWIRII